MHTTSVAVILIRQSLWALLSSALLLSAPAWAERADKEQPMHIESDALRYDGQKQASTFTGNVLVTKGTIVMRGARLDAQQDAAGNQSGTMTAEPGQRAFFRQKREGVDEYIEGEGERIEYDGKTDTVHFIGRAEMRRLAGTALQDEVKGSVITYNNVTEIYTVDGPQGASGVPSAASGKRGVSAVLAPRTAASAPAAKTSAAKAAASASAPVTPLQSSDTLSPTGDAK
jgi:lipopolysaccharide export system protein LptA